MNGRDKSIIVMSLITGFVVFMLIMLFGVFGLFLAPFIIIGSVLGWLNEDRKIRYEEEQQRLNDFNRNHRP